MSCSFCGGELEERRVQHEYRWVGPYTLDAFCALPEDVQVRLWDRAYAEAWEALWDAAVSGANTSYPRRANNR